MKPGPIPKESSFSVGIALMLVVLLIFSSALAAVVFTDLGEENTGDQEEDNNGDGDTFELEAEDLAFSGASAYTFARAQTNFGPRPIETPAHAETVEFLSSTFESFGLETQVVEFSAEFDGESHDFRNVVARKEGIYQGDGKDLVIFGAHFDTREIAEMDPNPANRSLPIMGANDGASGVAVLLELAQVVSRLELAPTMEFVLFDGEDFEIQGQNPPLAGSTHHANSLGPETMERVESVIVVDMIGDRSLDILRETNSNDRVLDDIFALAAELEYPEFRDQKGISIVDDHRPYLVRGLPAVDLIDFRYPDAQTNYWHTQEDTFDKLSEESLARVGKVLEAYLYNLSSELEKKTSWEEPYGLKDPNYLSFTPEEGVVDFSTSRNSDKIVPTRTTEEYNILNITGEGTLSQMVYHVHEQLNIGVGGGEGGRGDGTLVLSNVSFVSGSVEKDFFAAMGPGVVLDNCSFIFNNKDRDIRLSAGIVKNSLDIKGDGIVLHNIFLHNSPGFGAFIQGKDILVTGGVVSGCELGGLGFMNSTAAIQGLETRNNREFAIRAVDGTVLQVENSRFFDTMLEEECSNCGPPPIAPAIEVMSATVVVRDSLFRDNNAGIRFSYSSGEVHDSIFLGNVRGMELAESQSVTVTGSSFSNQREHGILSDNSELALSNSSFSDNNMGVTLRSSPYGAQPRVVDCNFTENGYGVMVLSSNANIRNNSFAGSNSASIQLSTPWQVNITGNHIRDTEKGIHAYSAYSRNYSYQQNVSDNVFLRVKDAVTMEGALGLNHSGNHFQERPAGARDIIQFWRLDILVLNESVGMEIEVEQNGEVLGSYTLQSGEKSRHLFIPQSWILDGEETLAGEVTVTVTEPSGGNGEPVVKEQSHTMDTHREAVLNF